MRFFIAALGVCVAGCDVTDNRRYQFVVEPGFNIYRLDTRTGEISFIEGASALTNQSSGYVPGRIATVMPPAE